MAPLLRTLTPAAIAGTAVLWTATFISAVTEHSSDRLHRLLLAAAVVAAIGCLVLLRERVAASRHARTRADMCDAVRQAADELHAVVEEAGETLRQDRQSVVAARTLTAALVHQRQADRHGQAV